MTVAQIHGEGRPLCKIFSNDFYFTIPSYQRPYSWTDEQARELLDDLLSFVGTDQTSVEELSPYFLGSIVLIKSEGKTDAQVVDGQQRLTTLTVLLSVLRHTITTPGFAAAMTDYLYQEGKPLEGTPNRYRLRLRERDDKFFRSHIQDQGQIDKLVQLNAAQLETDSQKNIKKNVELFLSRLGVLPEEQRVRLARFIVNNCVLVVVSTPDLDSAYRIFTILNDRGLDLSHSDILKSEIIGCITSNEQDSYTEKWEDAEEDLGRDAFSDLFGHTRTIFRKAKAKETILKEFRDYVIKPIGDSRKLIDEKIIPYAEAFATIKTASYQSTADATQVNDLLKWLGRIDNTDWIPPAILFLSQNKSDAKKLHGFFADLERLAAFMMVCRCGINERVERYGKLLDAIEKAADLYAAESPLQLSESESIEFVKELNGNVYEYIPQRRLYVLLRLDAALSDGSANYDHAVISIEHVLPQNPPAASEWCKWFPTQDLRDHWVHRLGNLLLLNHKKNSSASNYDFQKKKNSYFVKGGVAPFPLTTQAIQYDEWTLEVVEKRQRNTLQTLKDLWHLKADSALNEALLTTIEKIDQNEDD